MLIINITLHITTLPKLRSLRINRIQNSSISFEPITKLFKLIEKRFWWLLSRCHFAICEKITTHLSLFFFCKFIREFLYVKLFFGFPPIFSVVVKGGFLDSSMPCPYESYHFFKLSAEDVRRSDDNTRRACWRIT